MVLTAESLLSVDKKMGPMMTRLQATKAVGMANIRHSSLVKAMPVIDAMCAGGCKRWKVRLHVKKSALDLCA
jgi:hypothetical protein